MNAVGVDGGFTFSGIHRHFSGSVVEERHVDSEVGGLRTFGFYVLFAILRFYLERNKCCSFLRS